MCEPGTVDCHREHSETRNTFVQKRMCHPNINVVKLHCKSPVSVSTLQEYVAQNKRKSHARNYYEVLLVEEQGGYGDDVACYVCRRETFLDRPHYEGTHIICVCKNSMFL